MAVEVWAAIAAGIGGLLGGVIVALLSYWFQRRLEVQKTSLETKNLLVKKVINAYENVYKLKKYLSDRKQNEDAIVNSKDGIMTMKRKNVENFIDQANQLLNSKHAIYLPKNLREEFYNFRNLLFEIINHPLSVNQSEFIIQKDEIRLDIDAYIKNINEEIRNLNPDSLSDIKRLIKYIDED